MDGMGPNATDFKELLKDPIARILLQHEERIRSLETYMRIGTGVAITGCTLLGAILGALLLR